MSRGLSPLDGHNLIGIDKTDQKMRKYEELPVTARQGLPQNFFDIQPESNWEFVKYMEQMTTNPNSTVPKTYMTDKRFSDNL